MTRAEKWQIQKQKIEARKELIKNHPDAEYVEFIIEKVADFFKLSKDNLLSESRFRHYQMARNIAVKIAGEYTNLSDEVMFLFNRDRTTHYNAMVRFDADFTTQRAYRNSYNNLLTMCDRKSYTLYREFKEQAKKEIKWIVNT